MQEELLLCELKRLLGRESTETGQDEMLLAILQSVQARLCLLLGTEEVPEALDWVVTEAAVSRFNRVGSEGMHSHSVEGESVTFAEDDFSAFAAEIDAWRAGQEQMKRGRVRFL